jgi:hypothetical protein
MSYASETDLKGYLGISGTSEDTLLAALLARAQKVIEDYTGRTFEASDGTRYYDASYVEGDTLLLDADLISLTSLTNGDGTEIPSEGCWLLPRNSPPYYAIRLKSSYSWTFDTDGEIIVTGSWGYSTTPPATITHATIRLVAYYYRQKDTGVFDVTVFPEAGVLQVPKGLPEDVRILLEPYRRPIVR